MKKLLCFVLLACIFADSKAQRNFSLSALANFNFLTTGLGVNDAGVGLSVQGNAFAKKKLQIKAEASLDHFIGDKRYYTDAFGNDYPSNPTLRNFRMGPEFFVNNNISMTALYGYVTYQLFDYRAHSGNYKLGLTVHPPKHPKMLIAFQFTKLTGDNSDVHFFGVSVGSRIL
jgi:hypothetical protein